MLTLFSLPKPFAGHIEIIQRNAIRSWTLLRPRPEIVLIGDEPGTRELCSELDLRHVPEVERNPFGTPLISDVFARGQAAASHSRMGYVNADILLFDDFAQGAATVAAWRRSSLMVGRRWDLDVREMLDLQDAAATAGLRTRARQQGRGGPWAIDYFVFPRGLLTGLPPFGVGRMSWDNWLLWHIRSLGVPIVDATPSVMVVHQNHDFSHVKTAGAEPSDYKSFVEGSEEARTNRDLAAGHLYNIFCASHRLTTDGVRRNLARRHLRWLREEARQSLGDRLRRLRLLAD